ncbi:histidine phosphatase family protein [Magnetospira sp. QH-2]|uniref:histidine phosphatase family protein n=1 Tax=Magnetospira sp. (strain QH-2) TaxID=1288970 RepID=UPI0003E80B03|nr:histidine phosphatase family protein [Magnetospira sp. QH-2]CCQ74922.1 putative Phosphoglycerate mutase [Magnetospira sp. QH-2]
MTVRLAILRHGPTAWNREGRLQGRSDVPLDGAGRKTVSRWHLPPHMDDWRLFSSPLERAMETATLLCGREPLADPRLTETHWGDWEGLLLADLRDRPGAQGLTGRDFHAPGGEPPRDVMARLTFFLSERSRSGENAVVVAHKGVIRALYAMASGWDMVGKPPQKLKDGCWHQFTLNASAQPAVEHLNVPLESP